MSAPDWLHTLFWSGVASAIFGVLMLVAASGRGPRVTYRCARCGMEADTLRALGCWRGPCPMAPE